FPDRGTLPEISPNVKSRISVKRAFGNLKAWLYVYLLSLWLISLKVIIRSRMDDGSGDDFMPGLLKEKLNGYRQDSVQDRNTDTRSQIFRA
ncbi:hypothetical protein J8856_27330, partial [Klebsiella pneumoniae]